MYVSGILIFQAGNCAGSSFYIERSSAEKMLSIHLLLRVESKHLIRDIVGGLSNTLRSQDLSRKQIQFPLR